MDYLEELEDIESRYDSLDDYSVAVSRLDDKFFGCLLEDE